MTTRGYRPFPDRTGRNRRQARFELPVMTRALALPRGGEVLELGCGRGVALPGMTRLLSPGRLVGIDLDGDLLAEGSRRLRHLSIDCELVAGDVRAMPLPSAAFDIVIDFGTLFHIDSPELALAEVARVLRPGGLFVHETAVSQRLSHPVRSRGRRVPWRTEPRLQTHRRAVLWASRQRIF